MAFGHSSIASGASPSHSRDRPTFYEDADAAAIFEVFKTNQTVDSDVAALILNDLHVEFTGPLPAQRIESVMLNLLQHHRRKLEVAAEAKYSRKRAKEEMSQRDPNLSPPGSDEIDYNKTVKESSINRGAKQQKTKSSIDEMEIEIEDEEMVPNADGNHPRRILLPVVEDADIILRKEVLSLKNFIGKMVKQLPESEKFRLSATIKSQPPVSVPRNLKGLICDIINSPERISSFHVMDTIKNATQVSNDFASGLLISWAATKIALKHHMDPRYALETIRSQKTRDADVDELLQVETLEAKLIKSLSPSITYSRFEPLLDK